mgnify:CR=1 FL=1|tara:strand:- start:4437 stop:5288 length:852 start_codon:yes stop_codon:yes gene_type:complete
MKSNNTPLVSVIIAAYNEEKYIRKCIDSLLSQTFKDIEVIIINDGSTDLTLEILNKFTDNRVKIYSRSNKGRVVARNFALSKARGKYIVLQDADDWSELHRIEELFKQAEIIKNKPVVGSNYKIFNEITNKKVAKSVIENNIAIRDKMGSLFFSQAILSASIIIRRDHLISIGGWREKFRVAGEDGDLLERLYEDDSIFYNIQDTLYNYRLNQGSVTNNLELTIPYQIFKRDCKTKRRSGKKEFDSIDEFLKYVQTKFYSRIIYKMSYFAFYIAKRIRNTTND